MTVVDLIKQVFILLIILAFTPLLVREIKRQYALALEPRTPIGIITIQGVLTSATPYVQQLQYCFGNPEIKGILLKLDCPGTASGTGETIYTEIQALKRQHPKPVIGLIENVCTSGGYWIACAADYLIAPGTALVGNIGASLPYLFHLKEFMEQHHGTYTDMKAGTYKSILNPFVDLSPHDKELLQNVLDDSYQQFIQVVARTRKVSVTKPEQWADGKLFTGHQAYKLHLIDEIGGPQHAITILKQKALVEGGIEWIYPSSATSWWRSLSTANTTHEPSIVQGVINAITTQFGYQ